MVYVNFTSSPTWRQLVLGATAFGRLKRTGLQVAAPILILSLLLQITSALSSPHEQLELGEQQFMAGQQPLTAHQLLQHHQASPISLATGSASQSGSSQSSESSSATAAGSRSRSPRSIGEMFKKLFNGNKRSKQSGSQSSSSKDWDQQQVALQQQRQQQSQAASMAASLAAAAANQHAVYASPFAAYSPAGQSSALYSQFASPYAGGGLVAWPAGGTSLAQAMRATPTLLTSPSASPLYAAASQSYNSYAMPPAGANTGGPQAAASHAHPSAVPAPPGMGHAGGGGSSSLDFHQVLDALVRTSGFTPAGDSAEAAGYGSKSDGTPVFSFRKVLSLPFYLSTEEKSLDGLANAVGPASGAGAGYSLHSMPIMRRHVRRMSMPSLSQQQQQQQQMAAQHQYNSNLAALQQQAVAESQAAAASNQLQQRSERQQQQQYNNYINAINSQLASLSANNQLVQYLANSQQQQSSPLDQAYQADAALANYHSLGAGYKSSGIGARNGAGLATAASMMAPLAVQPPPVTQQDSASQKQQQQQQQQYEQQQQQAELQAILNSMQQQMSGDFGASASFFPQQFQSSTDGHRSGAQSQQSQQQVYQQPQQYYWQSGKADGSAAAAGLSQQDYQAPQAASNLSQPATNLYSSQGNSMDHQQLNAQQSTSGAQVAANSAPAIATADQSQQQVGSGGLQQQQQQQQQQQVAASQAAQIDGQQK